jgi:TatA/E family protein of Tat protein translocase
MGDLLSPSRIILIAFVVLLLFGGKKIPELMRALNEKMNKH